MVAREFLSGHFALVLAPLMALPFAQVSLAATSHHLHSIAYAGHSVSHHTTHSHSNHSHRVTVYYGQQKTNTAVGPSGSRYHGRYHGRSLGHARRHHVTAHRTRYAYPLNFFLWKAPDFEESPLSADMQQKIRFAFLSGLASDYSPDTLVRAGLIQHYGLKGGVFWRREPIKYIVMHSTETGIPQGAKRVIDSWGSLGRRHAGAQYVVDRDGQIYQAVDPELATVHINIFKTLPGINNDNCIGIEMVHAGYQQYTPEQKASVIRLVTYLQDHFNIADQNVTTHRYVQQGDHTDPVFFDWDGFISTKAEFQKLALQQKLAQLADDASKWWETAMPAAPTYLQVNGKLAIPGERQAIKNNKPLEAAPASLEKNSPANSHAEPSGGNHAGSAGTHLRGPMEMSPDTAKLLNGAQADPDNLPASIPDTTPNHN